MPDIRPAAASDLPAIAAIYADAVLHGTGSFEETPPSVGDMELRWRAIIDAGLPWIVAIVDTEIVGYAYAGPYKARSAYRFTVEDSVYVSERCRGEGVGRALLADLIERCAALGKRQMMGVVGDAGNAGSLALHESAGFVRIGHAREIGWKFGRWLDVVYLQRPLGIGERTPDEEESA